MSRHGRRFPTDEENQKRLIGSLGSRLPACSESCSTLPLTEVSPLRLYDSYSGGSKGKEGVDSYWSQDGVRIRTFRRD